MDGRDVEEEQIELKDCESTFVEERELDPEKVKEVRLEEVQFVQKKRLGTWCRGQKMDVVKGDGRQGAGWLPEISKVWIGIGTTSSQLHHHWKL